ncbi:hypothetical protein CKO38_02465 [Rhodospirillum rubrum]|uniref:hypothetical protein n=1 Tax=Rhodospirillum rubrum TaxID=1085 RepID=UPI0019055333|nr:hypothetical protein [Rhodospirillum rubrum]MBK1663382.1 hypothetical protein [Rhodospirillum rubrum]MBK1675554.1 hypothetical protein [Rhodospirillum rubrum]
MIRLFRRAIDHLAKPRKEGQEADGLPLLERVESERGWDERFAKTQDLLGAMAAQARHDVAEGDGLACDPSSDRPNG